ncbi:MAG: hypothetical protein EKK39_14280 [Sphingobacteriales bacterium]|nr:MAG: hypothetical protein EKK39_14280 [Sphingobacteriales bacterium]
MAQQSRNQLKQWYITGAYPTQQQFWDWLDSFWHKTADAIQITDVQNLLTTLQNKADISSLNTLQIATILPAGTLYYDFPAGYLLKVIWFFGPTPATIGVGYATGINDIFGPGQLDAGGDLVFDGIIPFAQTKRIYFNGIQPDTNIKIIKL